MTLTIGDFEVTTMKERMPYITWENIREVMPPDMYKRWQEVSRGSTSYIEGFYKHDLEKFLRLYNRGQ